MRKRISAPALLLTLLLAVLLLVCPGAGPARAADDRGPGPVPGTAGETLGIPPGADIVARTYQEISSETALKGQPWSGELLTPLRNHGRVVANPGQRVNGVVLRARRPGRFGGQAALEIKVLDVDGVPVWTDSVARRGGRRQTIAAGTELTFHVQ